MTKTSWRFSLPVESIVVFLFSHASRSVASLNSELVIFGHFELFKTESCLVARRYPTTEYPTQDWFVFTNWSLIGAVVLFDKTSSSCGVDCHVDQCVAPVNEQTRLDDHNSDYFQLRVWVNLVVDYHMALGKNVSVLGKPQLCVFTSAGSTVGHSSLWSLQSDIPSQRQADGTQRPLSQNCWTKWTVIDEV